MTQSKLNKSHISGTKLQEKNKASQQDSIYSDHESDATHANRSDKSDSLAIKEKLGKEIATKEKASKEKATTKTATINQPEKLLNVEAIKNNLTKVEELPVRWVTDSTSLDACLEDLASCSRLALDTEFIKRNTYFPVLALIQINTGETIYLIDAPKLELSDLWVVLENVPTMIWHACGEDLGIFYLLSNSPALTNVFDTQIALSYLTGQLQIGYQQALSQELDIFVPKGESQSDWLARPLTENQESYAIDDVRYLLSLYDILIQQLDKKQLTDKVIEDCQLYAKELYETANIEDDATYLAMADFRYTGEQLAVLQAVSSWREALARATNQPKTFILKKQAVRDIVTLMPKNMKQLTQKTTMHRHMARMYGDELIDVINHARSLSVEEQPALIAPPYRSKDKTVTKAIQQLVKEHASETGVPANVLMRKKWLSQLFEMVAYDLPYESIPEGLKGWRNDWVITTLIPFIENHKSEIRKGMGLAT